MQIRAMRNRASRGMTVLIYSGSNLTFSSTSSSTFHLHVFCGVHGGRGGQGGHGGRGVQGVQGVQGGQAGQAGHTGQGGHEGQ